MTDATMTPGASSLPDSSPLRHDARAWQRTASTQISCALGLALPMGLIAYGVQLSQAGGMTLRSMFLGPIAGGGALICWIVFLHRVVCGDGLERLGFFRKRPELDVLLGAALALALLAFQFAFQATAARWFPPRAPAPAILKLISGIARDPWLLALWLGPVVWFGVALFEEMARAFLLRRIWQAWRGAAGRWVGILVVSSLIGSVHLYQGPAAVVSIGLQSIALGWFYLRTGRIRALVVGHALYDSVQIVFAVVTIRQMGL